MSGLDDARKGDHVIVVAPAGWGSPEVREIRQIARVTATRIVDDKGEVWSRAWGRLLGDEGHRLGAPFIQRIATPEDLIAVCGERRLCILRACARRGCDAVVQVIARLPEPALVALCAALRAALGREQEEDAKRDEHALSDAPNWGES